MSLLVFLMRLFIKTVLTTVSNHTSHGEVAEDHAFPCIVMVGFNIEIIAVQTIANLSLSWRYP